MRKTVITTCSILGLLLTVSGCGGPSQWRGLVKVGLVGPLTGYDADTAYRWVSISRAAVDKWNSETSSYRIELVALDDGNNPETAIRRARELAVDPDIVAVVARDNGRGADLPAEYQKLGLPVVMTGSPLPASERVGNVWRICANAESEGARAGQYAIEEAHARRPAVIEEQGAGFRAAAGAFVASLPSDVRAVQFERPLNSPNPLEVREVARSLLGEGIDFVYFSGRYDVGAMLVKELGEGSVVRLLLGSDADTSSLSRLGVTDVKHIVTCVGHVERGTGQEGLAKDAVSLVLDAVAGGGGSPANA